MILAARLAAGLEAGRGGRAVLSRGDDAEPAAVPGDPAVPAAVLMAVTDRPEPGLILTVRTADLRTHSGQVAFPGGRLDPGEDAVAAALREAEEEVGLPPAAAAVVATLDPYRTITGFEVTPVLAAVPADLPLAPHEREVAEIFEAPLAHVLDPANHVARSAVYRGRLRHYHEIAFAGQRIWGATAAMIVNLSRVLTWPR